MGVLGVASERMSTEGYHWVIDKLGASRVSGSGRINSQCAPSLRRHRPMSAALPQYREPPPWTYCEYQYVTGRNGMGGGGI